MAKLYQVLNNGSEELPVTNGTLLTESNLDLGYDDGVFVISFFDASDDPVTPTAGTIVAEMSPITGQWQAPSSGDATIDATTVIAGSATYTMPRFSGPASQGRITLTGITGADHARAFFWRTRNNNNQ